MNRNSQNSHSPPASDGPQVEKGKKKKKKRKKRGGQPGHQGHSRPLYPVEECQQVRDHYPQTCSCCGEKLRGFDPNPYRHQVVEIPPSQLQIEEHRLHQLECDHCGEKTRATLPEEVEVSGYGDRVVAMVSLMSGMYRHSVRMVASAMSDFFSRTQFQSLLSPIRERVRSILSAGADYQIGSREKTPLAKTVRTCRQLLKVEAALWLFVTVEGLEPTNNAAERAIRPAVLWRRTSFGSQSEAGSVFVARMLTVVTSLRSQERDVLSFMTESIRAARQGTAPPSLLPQESSSTESIPLAA